MLENIIDPLRAEEVENRFDAEDNQLLDKRQLFFQQDYAVRMFVTDLNTHRQIIRLVDIWRLSALYDHQNWKDLTSSYGVS